MVFKDKHLGTETLQRSRKRRAGLDKIEEEPSGNQQAPFNSGILQFLPTYSVFVFIWDHAIKVQNVSLTDLLW